MAIQKSTPAVDGVHAFKLPDVGEGLIEAELLTWYVKPGDEVKDGQMICEIETAKAVVELPCPYSGTVKELFAAEGETVEVGTVIITVDDGTGGSGGGTAEADTGAETEEREKPLVGYGEKAASTQRRPRRRPAATAPTPAAPAPRAASTRWSRRSLLTPRLWRALCASSMAPPRAATSSAARAAAASSVSAARRPTRVST